MSIHKSFLYNAKIYSFSQGKEIQQEMGIIATKITNALIQKCNPEKSFSEIKNVLIYSSIMKNNNLSLSSLSRRILEFGSKEMHL